MARTSLQAAWAQVYGDERMQVLCQHAGVCNARFDVAQMMMMGRALWEVGGADMMQADAGTTVVLPAQKNDGAGWGWLKKR